MLVNVVKYSFVVELYTVCCDYLLSLVVAVSLNTRNTVCKRFSQSSATGIVSLQYYVLFHVGPNSTVVYKGVVLQCLMIVVSYYGCDDCL